VLRKGKSHHVCEYRLNEYLPFERDGKTRKELECIRFDGSIIDLAEVDGITAQIKSRISVPGKCYKNCPYSDDCRYRAFVNGAKNGGYDFIICNHQLLLADMKLRTDESGSILQPFQLLVLDEAHKVLPAARSIFGSELSAETIPNITAKLMKLNYTPLGATDSDSWKVLRDSANYLADKLYAVNKRLFNRDDCGAECDHILINIRDIADRLIRELKASRQFASDRDEQRKHGLIWELGKVSRAVGELFDSNGMVRWFKTEDEKRTAVSGIPKDLDKRLYSALWSRVIPAMLTSGTLSVGGDFSSHKNSLGLDDKCLRLSEVTHISPFN
jgi:ATP-dependent DNA helicase DinG